MFHRVTQGAVSVIKGAEPLNAEHVEKVVALLDECIGDGRPFAVLDLEKVPLLDSAGLEMILDQRDRLQRVGGSLKLASPNALCADILSVTGVGDELEVFQDGLSSVGSFVR